MEFILHLPQDIDKNGNFCKMWSTLCYNMQFFQNTGPQEQTSNNVSSLLLFAAHDQINYICSSLKKYDLDLLKINQILQVVEQVCLPYFVLLFERFKYFCSKRESAVSIEDYAISLKKQAEFCEFGNFEESIMTTALSCSVNESLAQYLSNTKGLQFDDSNVKYIDFTALNHNEIEMSLPSVKQNNSRVTKSKAQLKKEKDDKAHRKDAGKRKDGRKLAKQLIVKTKNATASFHVQNKQIAEDHFENESDFENVETSSINEMDNIISNHCTGINTDNKENLSSFLTIERIDTEDDIEMALSTLSLTKFHCCFCIKCFSNQSRLKKHVALNHKDCTPFQCKLCTNEFPNIEEYLMHYKYEHYVKVQKPKTVALFGPKYTRHKRCNCFHCGGGTVKEGCLKRVVNSFMCWHCEENFENKLDYKRHNEKHSFIGKFSCDLCQYRHRDIFRIMGHLNKHAIPQNKCTICGSTFIRQESLTRHLKAHSAAPEHICEICGKSFFLKYRLQSHMRVHTGEKRFTCELCGKIYGHRNNLQDHMRWHTGEKPFVCEICGKRSRSAADMTKHKRKHANKRSYVCDVCGKGFNYKHTLVRHSFGHTGKRSFACKDCGRTFIYEGGLSDHIKAQRCPMRRDSNFKRIPRTRKPQKLIVSNNLLDVVESEVYVHTQRASDAGLKDTQEWLCVLANNETEAAANILMVSSLY